MTAPANLELALALPLDVVANQLARIEADLRFLSMKAAAYADERENGELVAKVSGSLEKITEALDLIRGLVADMQAHIEPRVTGRSSRDRAARKSSADQDD